MGRRYRAEREGPTIMMLSSEAGEVFCLEGQYLFYDLTEINILLHISLDKVFNYMVAYLTPTWKDF